MRAILQDRHHVKSTKSPDKPLIGVIFRVNTDAFAAQKCRPLRLIARPSDRMHD
jgi:hypothetical protein